MRWLARVIYIGGALGALHAMADNADPHPAGGKFAQASFALAVSAAWPLVVAGVGAGAVYSTLFPHRVTVIIGPAPARRIPADRSI